MSEIKYPIFVDHKGERFIFPGVFSDETRAYDWSRCRQICFALGVTEEEEPLVVPVDENGSMTIVHVKAEAGSSGFARGSSDVWLIGGPTFDAILQEEKADA